MRFKEGRASCRVCHPSSNWRRAHGIRLLLPIVLLLTLSGRKDHGTHNKPLMHYRSCLNLSYADPMWPGTVSSRNPPKLLRHAIHYSLPLETRSTLACKLSLCFCLLRPIRRTMIRHATRYSGCFSMVLSGQVAMSS